MAQARSRRVEKKWNDMVEAEAAESRRLGLQMSRALVALHHFDGPEGCFPALKTIAGAADVSVGTVLEAIRRAEEMGYLVVVRSQTEMVARGSRVVPVRRPNRYFFRLPEAAVPHKDAGLEWRAAWRAAWWAAKNARRRPDSSLRCVNTVPNSFPFESDDAAPAWGFGKFCMPSAGLAALRVARAAALGVSG